MASCLRGGPNTRVQRTRSSASRRHSPLTRSPLGVKSSGKELTRNRSEKWGYQPPDW